MESGWEEPDAIKLENLLKLGSPALVEKLRTYKPEGVGSSDEIRQLASKEPQRAIDALRIIGETHEEWPHEVWRRVLSGLEDDGDVATKVSQDLTRLIVQAPDDLLTEVGHAISTWLRNVIGSDTPNPDVRHMELWKRVWNTAPEEDTSGRSDPLTAAINDRAGVLAEALLNILWARKPKTDEGIPPDLLPLFDLISQGTRPSHVFGRVILASRLYNLFALDPDWSSKNILPRMDWDASEEAASLWAGYLWSPRVGPNLGAAFKNLFIKAIANRHAIDRHGEHLVELFAAMSTEMLELLSEPETKRIVDGLDEDGLVGVVRYFEHSAQAADKEQQGRIWKEKYGLWLDQYWPRVADRKTPQTAKAIAGYLCETGTAFPEAFSWAESFLQPVEYPGPVTHKLVKSQLPKEFPEETLRFVGKVISADSPAHERYKLRELLDRIVETAPHLRTHPTYLALNRIA